jgi:hypothetical protein
MVDLTQADSGSPAMHTVASDPGLAWTKRSAPAIEAAPDDDTSPAPDARWPTDAPRTGVCGSVSPRVLRLVDGSYRLYYTQILPRPGFPAGANDYDNATTRILSATSVDGVLWTPEPGVRLTPQQAGAGEFRVVSAEVVPFPGDAGRLRMYFEACAGPQRLASSIRSATSADGLTWTVDPGVRLGGDGGNLSAVRIIFLDDGRMRMYVNKRGSGIISAVSSDGGTTFSEEGARFAFDPSAFALDVVRLPDGSYRGYYSSHDPSRPPTLGGSQQIVSVLSADGLEWRPDGTAIVPTPGGLDAAKCSEMCTFPLPASAPGGKPGHGILYEGCDGTTADARGVWRVVAARTE